VFEVDYVGAVGPENDRRNWWGGAREVARVTKGKGILVSGGAEEDKYIRAPRDAANLYVIYFIFIYIFSLPFCASSTLIRFARITLLGLAQNLSLDTVSHTPKIVLLRAGKHFLLNNRSPS